MRQKEVLQMSNPRKVIISGGGTGGHIFPAIAIADAIKRKDSQIEILFVGATGRMEMSRVPAAGYQIKGLWISGFQRTFTLSNLLFPLKLLVSMIQALFVLTRFKPDLVIGVGGFASGPLIKAATWMGISSAIQEQNALPGITNKLLGKKVDKVFVAYQGMDRFFPADKISYLGNPVRAALVNPNGEASEARAVFGLSASRKTILVFGGSLGAGILNECMEKASTLIADHPEVQWIWQTGTGYEDIYKDSKTGSLSNVRKLTFIDRMDLAYLACDLVVCRAGALTISEICLIGKASILIPSPFVAEDHQTVNAMALADVGAAVLINQSHAGDKLILLALETVSNDKLLEKIEKNAKALGMPHADENIASDLLEMIRKKENG